MQPDTMFVRPSAGLRVIDPRTRKPIPEAGAEVPRNGYWTKRLQHRDVLEVEVQSKPAIATADPAAKGETQK